MKRISIQMILHTFTPFLFFFLISINYIEGQKTLSVREESRKEHLGESVENDKLILDNKFKMQESSRINSCPGCLPPPPCERVVNGDVEQVSGNTNELSEVCGWISTQSSPFYCNGPNNNALGFLLRVNTDVERIGSCDKLNFVVGEQCSLKFDYLVTTLRNYENNPPRAIQIALLDNNAISLNDGAPLPTTASIIAQINFPIPDYEGQIHDACYRENEPFNHHETAFTITNPNNQYLHITGIPFYQNVTSTQVYIDNISISCCVDPMCEPEPDFTWHGCNPTIFEGTNTGDGTDYTWSFLCDGTSATGSIVSHNLPLGVECTVCLTIACDSLTEKTICKRVKVECPPDTCIQAQVVDVHCKNKGTTNPTDDFWYFDLLVNDLTGNGVYWTTTGDIVESGSYGTVKTIYPSGNIANNPSYTFDVFDAIDTSCRTTVTAYAPPPCSDSCNLNVQYTISECIDPGTPYYISDDYFKVTLDITGTGGLPFMIKQKYSNGTENLLFSGTGDQSVTLTFLSQNGDFTLWVFLSDYFDCLVDIYIDAPPTCSGCLQIATTNITCFDNGTADPSDDYWTFDMTVVGGTSYWIADSPINESGPYGIPKTIYMGSISNGPVSFEVYDAKNPKCRVKLTVEPPKPCSEECKLEVKEFKTYCKKIEGIYYYFVSMYIDVPADDCFMVKRKNPDGTEELLGTYYGPQSLNLGPFSPAEEFTLWISLCEGSDCVKDFYVKAPRDCKNCIDYKISKIKCYDNGTSDPSDDYWTFELLVYGPNTYWVAGDPINQSGVYGVPTTIVVSSFDDIVFKLYDKENPDCITKVRVKAPEKCSERCKFEVKHKILECIRGEDGYFFNIALYLQTSSIGCFIITKIDMAGNETVLGTFPPNTDFEIGPFPAGEDFILTFKACDDPEGCQREIFIKAPDCSRGEPKAEARATHGNTTLAPNPVKGILKVTSNQVMHNLTVYNIAGVKLNQYFVNNTEYTIDTEKLNSGLYFVKIGFDNNESSVYKFIKIE